MGLFKNLFGSGTGNTKVEKKLPWVSLKEMDQLTALEQNSFERPQIIFKHSTTCGISRMVLGMFTETYPLAPEEADLHFLDLHAYRNLSNEIAARFQVMHQSPQLLIVKGGETVHHSSHGAITEIDLTRFQ